jgi:hypothetical protein
MQNEITKDLKGIYSHRSSNFNSIDFLMPDCKSIDVKNIINHIDIYKNPYSFPWYKDYLKRYNDKDIKYLVDQLKGDDWIIGWYSDSNIYMQFIDGRSFTVLLKFLNNDTVPITGNIDYESVYKILSKYIKCTNLYINGCSKINITYSNNNFFEGYFSDDFINFSDLKKDFIWSNGRYIILDIVKLKKPYRMIKSFKYYDHEAIIDGIPKNDKRSFTRFRYSNNIDLNTEMYRVFPWMKDSIQYYKTHMNTELYGKTPDYSPLSKEDEDKLMKELREALEKDTCNH